MACDICPAKAGLRRRRAVRGEEGFRFRGDGKGIPARFNPSAAGAGGPDLGAPLIRGVRRVSESECGRVKIARRSPTPPLQDGVPRRAELATASSGVGSDLSRVALPVAELAQGARASGFEIETPRGVISGRVRGWPSQGARPCA